MCPMLRRMPPLNQLTVPPTKIFRNTNTQTEKTQVRMQNPHVALCVAQPTPQAPRGPVPCKAGRSNFLILAL